MDKLWKSLTVAVHTVPSTVDPHELIFEIDIQPACLLHFITHVQYGIYSMGKKINFKTINSIFHTIRCCLFELADVC